MCNGLHFKNCGASRELWVTATTLKGSLRRGGEKAMSIFLGVDIGMKRDAKNGLVRDQEERSRWRMGDVHSLGQLEESKQMDR